MLATGYKLQLSHFWTFSGFFVFSWLEELYLQAKLCKAFLVSSAILWLLCEFYLSEGWKLEPSIVKNGVNPISNITKSSKGKLVWQLLVLTGIMNAIKSVKMCCKHCIVMLIRVFFVFLLMPFTCNDWKHSKRLDIWHLPVFILTLLEIPTCR